MIPLWLHDLSLAYLSLGAGCALLLTLDLLRRPQRMWIMNVVWPSTALFGTIAIVGQYLAYGRVAGRQARHSAAQGDARPSRKEPPFAAIVASAALHCGSGCTLGDICAEWLVFFVPGLAAAFGFHRLFSERIFSTWIVDYVLAYGFGIVFQYFTIAPMRRLSLRKGLIAAIKADTLSLTAWQVGMYGFMAVAHFAIFRSLLGVELRTDSVEFWFMMQIAMIAGFATSFPVNAWLLHRGLKEPM